MRPSALSLVLAVVACRAACAAPPAAVERVHALLLNGGGSKHQNYQSHLLHVQQLFAQLERAGVDRTRIDVFSGDGDDPDPDVAIRDPSSEDRRWLVDGTRLDATLRPPIAYTNTVVDGADVRPATRAALAAWFADEGRSLVPGDTLLLYVTDHGTKNADDTANNRITLYGKDETLSVQGLAALLDTLAPGVRVVMLMSQCYSGAFAGLAASTAGTDRPAGDVCGYFSSTADRPAYGCYPENRGRENVGHSFHFLEGFARTGSLAAAHDEVLVADATPDVPLRTSDRYLDDLLRRAADAAGEAFAPFVDRLLDEAWRNRAAWEADIRRLDRIAAAFGMFSPRSLHELDEQSARIDAMAEQLNTHGRAWARARESLARANLDRFLLVHADWSAKLAPATLAALPRPEVDALAGPLLDDMAVALADDEATGERFAVLRDRTRVAQALGYRMEVRQGAVLRLRALLVSIAGRVRLATDGTPLEHATYGGLRACEDLRLPPVPLPAGTELVRAEPFPVLDDDVRLADTVLPAWMGIQFRQARESLRKERRLADGAASVMMVYDDSPASAAGIREGDVLLGPPGAPFTENEQVREWVMRSPADIAAPLELLRGDERLVVSLVPKAMPQKWPSLPGPPKIGAEAPAVRLGAYRGDAPTTLADGRSRLLFFWATWCAVCKTAVPELVDFERERGTSVIAITDETAAELDPFFAEWQAAFPGIVATDENRASFRSYGVSGTPTFVLVDGDGVVRSYATGYSKAKGLGIEGWQWAPASSVPAS